MCEHQDEIFRIIHGEVTDLGGAHPNNQNGFTVHTETITMFPNEEKQFFFYLVEHKMKKTKKKGNNESLLF